MSDTNQDITAELLPQIKQVVACLYEKKAQDIVVINVEGQTSYCDLLVLCSGTSGRHVRALAEHVVAMMKAAGSRPLGTEGLGTGRWVLVDLGAIVVHIFDGESRLHYDLDGMWVDAPRLPFSELGIPEEAAPDGETAPFLS